MAQLLETMNTRTGKRRWYVDGRRVSFGRFYDTREGAWRLDTFQTVRSGAQVRFYCQAKEA